MPLQRQMTSFLSSGIASPIAMRQLHVDTVNPVKLIIGAMMRKLVHVAFGVLKSGKSFYPTLHGA